MNWKVLLARIAICETIRRISIKFGIVCRQFSVLNVGPCKPKSRDSAVGIATVNGQDDRGVEVRVPVGSKIFSSPRRPDRLWSPPNLVSNGYRGSFPVE
jgi:hypothetical protein